MLQIKRGGALLRLFVVLGLLPVAWRPVGAGERPVLSAGPPPVVSIADRGDATLQLEGRFTTTTSRAIVWNVLTDYDHIQEFVSSMRSSHVKEHGNGFLIVEQESVAKVLFFQRTFHLLLKVREEPQQSIAFEDVSRASFEHYDGSWSLKETPAGIEVIYRLTAKGGFMTTGFMSRTAARNMAEELLEQVRTEMSHRAGAKAAGSPRSAVGAFGALRTRSPEAHTRCSP